jgi:hypothetical protein
MPTEVGSLYPITVQTRAASTTPGQDGALTDTGSVTITIINQATGLVVAGPTAMAHASTGTYTYDYLTTVAGPFRWEASAAGAIEGEFGDVFQVDDGSGSFISVTEAVAQLRAAGTITTVDDLDQLQFLCQIACDAVERDIGRVIARRTITDYFDGGGSELRLRKIPLRPADGGQMTVASVTENGIALVEGIGFVVRRNTWRLVRGNYLAPFEWWPAVENVVVTYTISCTRVPLIARKVALNGVQRMWQGSQQLPVPYSDDISGDQAIGSAVAGTLTPLELTAYRSLGKGAFVA